MTHQTKVEPDAGMHLASCSCGWRERLCTRDGAVRATSRHSRAAESTEDDPTFCDCHDPVPIQNCETCSGTACQTCAGAGELEEQYGGPHRDRFSRMVPCPDCGDDGADRIVVDSRLPDSDDSSPFPEARK